MNIYYELGKFQAQKIFFSEIKIFTLFVFLLGYRLILECN
jgi:hypothetical protein